MKIIIPIKSYINPFVHKKQIYKENRNKSGIYRWNNLITGKSYVGSSSNITKRLYNYLSYKHLESRNLKSNSLIYESLLEYKYSNFSLDILKYCEKNELIKWEQYFIDTLNPKYNKNFILLPKERISAQLKGIEHDTCFKKKY